MRKKKRRSPLAPFAAGVAAGYGAALIFAALAAGALTITDTAATASGAAAVVALAAGSFVCGRVAGKLRRKGGLKTGALCGILFIIPTIVASLFFGLAGGVLLIVKTVLCVIFGMVGGVSGVNSESA